MLAGKVPGNLRNLNVTVEGTEHIGFKKKKIHRLPHRLLRDTVVRSARKAKQF